MDDWQKDLITLCTQMRSRLEATTSRHLQQDTTDNENDEDAADVNLLLVFLNVATLRRPVYALKKLLPAHHLSGITTDSDETETEAETDASSSSSASFDTANEEEEEGGEEGGNEDQDLDEEQYDDFYEEDEEEEEDDDDDEGDEEEEKTQQEEEEKQEEPTRNPVIFFPHILSDTCASFVSHYCRSFLDRVGTMTSATRTHTLAHVNAFLRQLVRLMHACQLNVQIMINRVSHHQIITNVHFFLNQNVLVDT